MIFEKAVKFAPSLIFIDDIDSIVARKDAGQPGSGTVEKKIVAQLTTLLDQLDYTLGSKRVAVIAATSRPSSLDESQSIELSFRFLCLS